MKIEKTQIKMIDKSIKSKIIDNIDKINQNDIIFYKDENYIDKYQSIRLLIFFDNIFYDMKKSFNKSRGNYYLKIDDYLLDFFDNNKYLNFDYFENLKDNEYISLTNLSLSKKYKKDKKDNQSINKDNYISKIEKIENFKNFINDILSKFINIENLKNINDILDNLIEKINNKNINDKKENFENKLKEYENLLKEYENFKKENNI